MTWSRDKDGKPVGVAGSRKVFTMKEAKARHLVRTMAYHTRCMAAVRKFKDVSCMDCKKKYPYYIMDFDHRNSKEKKFSVGIMASSLGLPGLAKEIAKCDVVCANCHRERTHQRRMKNGA